MREEYIRQNESAYSYTFFHSVVCLSVCRPSVCYIRAPA